jgi:hypothetical protein
MPAAFPLASRPIRLAVDPRDLRRVDTGQLRVGGEQVAHHRAGAVGERLALQILRRGDLVALKTDDRGHGVLLDAGHRHDVLGPAVAAGQQNTGEVERGEHRRAGLDLRDVVAGAASGFDVHLETGVREETLFLRDPGVRVPTEIAE